MENEAERIVALLEFYDSREQYALKQLEYIYQQKEVLEKKLGELVVEMALD